MTNTTTILWNRLHASFWFVPSLLVAASIVLAMALIQADASGGKDWLAAWPRLFGAGAAGARGMLSTIAGSMMTVVGVTFSMTLVTLTLASGQYTSRILRNFMSDRATQGVLGVFAGIFTYCLIVLRTIRGDDEGGFVPTLSVFAGVLMAIGSIGVLIFFIHHIASSIQASQIIASVAEETLQAVDRLFPQRLAEGPENSDEDRAIPPLRGQTWREVPAPRNGYIQLIDSAVLLSWAREHDTLVRMEQGIGDFVVEGTPLAFFAGATPEDETFVALQEAYSIGRHRTMEQDAAFGIRQIVDIALRALSPGVNDTTTAVMCVDYLTAILGRLAIRSFPASHRHDEGQLRVIAVGSTFAGLLEECFGQIRICAQDNLAILLRMLGSLHTIARLTSSPDRHAALREQAESIREVADRAIVSPRDRARVSDRLAQVREALSHSALPS